MELLTKSAIEKYDLPVTEIEPDRNYWLVRTQSGEFYDDFFFDEFIAIGWDEFNDVKKFNSTEKSIFLKDIESQYPDVSKPGLIYNSIDRFINEIDVGDIVMIPSVNSKHISFGEVISDVYIEEISDSNIEEGVCPFGKRRNVKWLKTLNRKNLDPYLYKMMQSHHTINKANDYADVIDRTLHSLYIKGEKAHLVLEVKQKDDISGVDLITGINDILELVEYVKYPGDEEQDFKKEDINIKLRVQSPGIIEFISSGNIAWAVIGLGLILTFTVGGSIKANFSKGTKEIEASSDGLLEKILKFKKHGAEQRLLELESKNQETVEKLKLELPEETKNLPESQELEEK